MTLGISPIFPIADFNGYVLNYCVFCILKEQNYIEKKRGGCTKGIYPDPGRNVETVSGDFVRGG